jgi:hypothetical protein
MRMVLRVVMGAATLQAACGPAPSVNEPAATERIATRREPPLRARALAGGFQAYGQPALAVDSLYEGHYLCSQGETGMALRIDDVRGRRVGGVFSFFHESTAVRGSFVVEGELAPSGEIVFQPREWIEHPNNYIAVPFRLQVSDDGGSLRGAVMHASCGLMEAQRVASP